MSKHSSKPVSLAVAAVLVGGMGLSASAFAMTDLAQGYLLSAGEATKAAEGKCGMAKMDTDKDDRISKTEFSAAHGGDGSKFAAHDPDMDGFISAGELKAHHEAGAMKAGMEGKCGEGKCGADTKAETKKVEKAGMEGKCGEGKCGGTA
jgi:uncharacterized low-complexity protein